MKAFSNNSTKEGREFLRSIGEISYSFIPGFNLYGHVFMCGSKGTVLSYDRDGSFEIIKRKELPILLGICQELDFHITRTLRRSEGDDVRLFKSKILW
jgi:hypothetical protein